eukprot:scaffold45401_cov53-Attheya_sp.AAC.1
MPGDHRGTKSWCIAPLALVVSQKSRIRTTPDPWRRRVPQKLSAPVPVRSTSRQSEHLLLQAQVHFAKALLARLFWQDSTGHAHASFIELASEAPAFFRPSVPSAQA